MTMYNLMNGCAVAALTRGSVVQVGLDPTVAVVVAGITPPLGPLTQHIYLKVTGLQSGTQSSAPGGSSLH